MLIRKTVCVVIRDVDSVVVAVGNSTHESISTETDILVMPII